MALPVRSEVEGKVYVPLCLQTEGVKRAGTVIILRQNGAKTKGTLTISGTLLDHSTRILAS